jgi:hypothetical protein
MRAWTDILQHRSLLGTVRMEWMGRYLVERVDSDTCAGIPTALLLSCCTSW